MINPIFINCELIKITNRNDKSTGARIILKELMNDICHEILVDESVSRVKTRLMEQYQGNDEREGVYLSKGMINVNINTRGDVWDISQEDWHWYKFSKEDILNEC